MTNSLTDRQSEVLKGLKRLIDLRGISPTMQELSLEMGCTPKSKVGMASNLKALVVKGYVNRIKGSPRSMSLTQQAKDYLATNP